MVCYGRGLGFWLDDCFSMVSCRYPFVARTSFAGVSKSKQRCIVYVTMLVVDFVLRSSHSFAIVVIVFRSTSFSSLVWW